MNSPPFDDLDPDSGRALTYWRAEPVPVEALDSALDRLARMPPRRALRWLPRLVAACLALLFFLQAPVAVAALADVLSRPVLAVAPVGVDAVRAAWRPVLLVHIACLMLGYLMLLVGFLAGQFDTFLRLLSLGWLRRWGPRLGSLGAAAGTALWLAGVLLGAWWASAVLGRWWGWGIREVHGLITLALGALWWYLARRVRDHADLWPAIIGACGFWAVFSSYWFVLVLPSGHASLPIWLSILGCLTLNILLLVSAWLVERRRPLPE